MKKLLVILLFLAVFAPWVDARAATPTPKEEVVYATMTPAGEATQTIVVNSFPEAQGTITDYGTYEDVVNLTTTDPITTNGDVVSVATEPGDFAYQGVMRHAQLPWIVTITYHLDGKPVTAEQLKGADGQMRMDIAVRKNPQADPVYFENYLATIQVTLSTTWFKEIASEQAMIATAGDNKVLSFTSMKGTENDYTITARAQNAHLGPIQIVGLPYVTAISMPDMDGYIDQMRQLKQAIAALNDGVQRYHDGVSRLATGSDDLAAGGDTLAANAAVIAQSTQTLRAARQSLGAGLSQYADGADQFQAGIVQLTDGMAEFRDGMQRLRQGSQRLSDGMATYADGVDQFSEGLGAATDGSAQLTDGLQELSDGLDQLVNKGKYDEQNLVGSSEKILNALQLMDAALRLPMDEEQLARVRQYLNEFFDATEQLTVAIDTAGMREMADSLESSLASLNTGLQGITAATDAMSDPGLADQLGIDATNPDVATLLNYMNTQAALIRAEVDAVNQLTYGLDYVPGQIRDLADRLDALNQAMAAMSGLLGELRTTLDQIPLDQVLAFATGVHQLATNYALFHEGLVAYVDGVEKAQQGVSGTPGLLDGSKQLHEGLTTLDTNGKRLASGAHELADGAGELHQGVVALDDATLQMSEGTGPLLDGAQGLSSGAHRLSDGYVRLARGHDLLDVGLGQFAAGTQTFAQGVHTLSDGAHTLANGGDQLADGASRLASETATMDTDMRAQITEAMAPFQAKEFEMHSFTSPRNTQVEQVQFMYIYDGQPDDGAPAPAPAEPEKRSIWERIMDLFRPRP